MPTSIFNQKQLTETVKLKDAEIERLKHFLAACAVIFERRIPVTTDFIDELRKAAK